MGWRGIGGLGRGDLCYGLQGSRHKKVLGRVFQAGETANTKPQDRAELSWCVGKQ